MNSESFIRLLKNEIDDLQSAYSKGADGGTCIGAKIDELNPKQDRYLWEVKADFTKAIFVANCLGKRFFLV
ncbi:MULTISPECIES: hypothetical protein [Alteromonas]|uniref:hypothetical protein n=1 Tax=Alteromonas TaxID=226 RepID=UPI0026E3A24D|nr:hypothetical protein [Alteromonas stellipolaris]MDO6533808.1 hypothetical protein [Alteromonas stellipolaris]MDO6626298.1 hypothetical protein [Alteromonas stellipolaris]